MVGFDGTGLTTPILACVRDHFLNHVRTGGPCPALSCARQPYGVLPVTSLDAWKPPAGQEQAFASDSWLRDLLQKLRNNIWRPRTADAFRMGRRSPSAPDADLADIMRMDAASGAAPAACSGRHSLRHLRALRGEDLQATGFIATDDALAAGLLQRLGIAWRPRLARMVGSESAWAVSAPLVQDGEVSPWRGLEPNYIQALLDQRSISVLTQARPDPGSPTPGASLLQLLLRHALLRELADAAAFVAGGADPTPFLRDAELIDLVTDQPSPAPPPPWTRRLDLCRRPASPAIRACGNTSKGSTRSTRRQRPRLVISAAASPGSRTATARPCSISYRARSISRHTGSMRGSRRSPRNDLPP
jgi:hypothetical protein